MPAEHKLRHSARAFTAAGGKLTPKHTRLQVCGHQAASLVRVQVYRCAHRLCLKQTAINRLSALRDAFTVKQRMSESFHVNARVFHFLRKQLWNKKWQNAAEKKHLQSSAKSQRIIQSTKYFRLFACVSYQGQLCQIFICFMAVSWASLGLGRITVDTNSKIIVNVKLFFWRNIIGKNH